MPTSELVSPETTFWVLLPVLLLTVGCGSKPPVTVGSGPAKVARACQAIDESMESELTESEIAWCERNLAVWYAESRFSRADPADRYDGNEQLEYFMRTVENCKRAADHYEQHGLDRRNLLMRCLVISRRRDPLEERPAPLGPLVPQDPG